MVVVLCVLGAHSVPVSRNFFHQEVHLSLADFIDVSQYISFSDRIYARLLGVIKDKYRLRSPASAAKGESCQLLGE